MLHFGDLIELPTICVRAVRGGDGANWPAHEVIEGKPRRQFIGPNGRDLSVSLYLHVGFGIAPRPVLTRLQQICETGEVFQLWTSSGAYWGTFEIEQVDHDPRWTLPTGQIISMGIELKLADPGVEGEDALVRPAAIAGNATNTTTVLPVEDTSVPPELVTPAEIARI
jgi:phage protein U